MRQLRKLSPEAIEIMGDVKQLEDMYDVVKTLKYCTNPHVKMKIRGYMKIVKEIQDHLIRLGKAPDDPKKYMKPKCQVKLFKRPKDEYDY